MQLRNPFGDHSGMAAIKARADVYSRHYAIDRCLRRCLRAISGESNDPVPKDLVSEIYAHWGDPLTQSGENYLRSCFAEARKTEGHILQCGTSLLTLLLGALCAASESKAKQLWCLEHDAHWANLMRSWITQYEVNASHVISARAELFGPYVWYAIDPARLADRFSLVLCDGANATPQGVLGTLDKLADRLALDAVILVRKVGKAADLKALAQWAETNNAACAVVDKREGFIKISCRGSRPTLASASASASARASTAPKLATIKAPEKSAQPTASSA